MRFFHLKEGMEVQAKARINTEKIYIDFKHIDDITSKVDNVDAWIESLLLHGYVEITEEIFNINFKY